MREVVLAFGLCPWADGVLRAGAVARHVLPQVNPSVEACLAVLDAWARGDRAGQAAASRVDIGLLVMPRRAGGRGSFDSLAEAVRRADRGRRAAGTPAPFVIAAFHPEGGTQVRDPHQLVSFVRRTPDPLLQLVRADLIEQAHTAATNVSEQIGARNFATLSDPMTAARFETVIGELRADRDATYARLGVARPG